MKENMGSHGIWMHLLFLSKTEILERTPDLCYFEPVLQEFGGIQTVWIKAPPEWSVSYNCWCRDSVLTSFMWFRVGFRAQEVCFFLRKNKIWASAILIQAEFRGSVVRGIPFTNRHKPTKLRPISTNAWYPHPPVAWYHARQRNATTLASSKKTQEKPPGEECQCWTKSWRWNISTWNSKQPVFNGCLVKQAFPM